MVRKQVGILVFPEVEVLDFCGPFEVLSATRLDESRRRDEPSPFEVFLVAETMEPIRATGACVYCRTTTWRTVPGSTCSSSPAAGERGVSCRTTASSAGFASGSASSSWQLRCARGHSCTVRPVCSITAAPRLTGNHSIACNKRFPSVTVVRDQHVVEDGSIVTSAGIAAGIDLAIRVVARLCGEPVARATARYMEYPYPETNHRRV